MYLNSVHLWFQRQLSVISCQQKPIISLCLRASVVKNMKKYIIVILLLTLSGVFLPCFASAKTIKVGLYQNKPLIFTEKNGDESGFYIDILKYIAKKEGWELQYVRGSWQECAQRLQGGEIDVLAGVPYSKETAGKYLFANVPILSNWAQVYTLKNSRIQTIIDLDKKTVAGVKNDIYFEDLKSQIEMLCPTCNIIEMEDNDAVFNFLSQQFSDAGITDVLYGMKHEREYGLAGVSIVSSPKELYFAIPLNGDVRIITVLDKHLFDLKNNDNSVYHRSLDRWLGGVGRWTFPVWLVAILVLAGTMLAMFLFMNNILRQQVLGKTNELLKVNKALEEEIKERKWAHDKLSETLMDMEKRIRERTSELSQSNELLKKEVAERRLAEEKLQQAMNDLSRSNRELEQFAYVVSHDLKEPLRMVTSYLQLLERRYKGKLDKDAKEFIDFAKDGGKRMETLIEDLLSYSRLDTFSKRFEQVDCNAIVDGILDVLGIAIEKNRAEVTRDPLPGVIADKTQLGQVFQNLISNALKFRSKKPPAIHVGAPRVEGEWLFRISDNGIGIDPKDAERVFVIFQRLHSRDEYPGTGVGLAICKKIVEYHGGKIWIESEPGKGSTFCFTIPDR